MKTTVIRQIRTRLLLFIIALMLSGITAPFVEAELRLLLEYTGPNFPFRAWLTEVYHGLKGITKNYNYVNYGFDWLAFGHIIIATFFIGPLLHPIKNKWVII